MMLRGKRATMLFGVGDDLADRIAAADAALDIAGYLAIARERGAPTEAVEGLRAEQEALRRAVTDLSGIAAWEEAEARFQALWSEIQRVRRQAIGLAGQDDRPKVIFVSIAVAGAVGLGGYWLWKYFRKQGRRR